MTALQMGLLHQVVPAPELDAALQRQLDLLLKVGPLAAAGAKSLVSRTAREQDPQRQDQANAELIASLRVSPEGQEGLSAFLDKRPPGWTRENS